MTLKTKMVTCTCGNIDLEKLPVRLQVTGDDGRTLSLFALICRGDGCGRVTFRPQESPKSESDHRAKSVNGHHFVESARVIEGAKLVDSAKVVEAARLVEGARLVERPRAEEGARLIESSRVAEGARLIDTPGKNGTNAKETQNTEESKGVAALFERVYTERLVYKAIAERDPNCPNLFDALKKNEQICSGINAAFAKIYQRLDDNEDLLAVLESLPSLAGRG